MPRSPKRLTPSMISSLVPLYQRRALLCSQVGEFTSIGSAIERLLLTSGARMPRASVRKLNAMLFAATTALRRTQRAFSVYRGRSITSSRRRKSSGSPPSAIATTSRDDFRALRLSRRK